MFAHEVVNAEMQRDRQLVHFQAFAVAQSLALKPLQFLPYGQESQYNCALIALAQPP